MTSRQSVKRGSQDNQIENTQIIEEKIVKVNGDQTVRRYSKGRFLGKGGFAKVYEFVNLENNKISAGKVVPKASLTKSRAKQKLMSEIKIHRSLHHTNVVSFEHFFEDAENVYILLELCSNQTTNEMLRRRKRLTEIEIQCYIVQCINALKYLHSHRVIHRDLKLGNLFLSEKMEIKIGDFGLATKLEFEGEKKRTICGTPNYIAPEILDGKQGHSYEVDTWSLGVVIYTLLIGKPPFETSDVKTTYRRIRMNAYTFPEHIAISDAAKSLITRILNGEPSRRPSLDEILNHEFFHQGWVIPKLMPASTLACPPPSSFIKQFMPNNALPQKSSSLRLADTVPSMKEASVKQRGQDNLLNTERISSKKDKPQTPQVGGQKNSKQIEIGRPATSRWADTNSSKSARPAVKTSANFNSAGQKGSKVQEIYVKKWVDYSSKYGLGYLLSNGSTGVFFNDSTKIILDQKGKNFDYIERRQSEKQDIIETYKFDDFPKEIQKKVTLLQHFRAYLEGEKVNFYIQDTQEENLPLTTKMIYVKKWMRTKHAIMFRLSNKIVQVNFQDQTEIILSSETRIVTYINKQGERLTYPLTSALESSNAEMSKRLKYTKDILTHMLSSGQQQQGGTGSSRAVKSPTSDRISKK